MRLLRPINQKLKVTLCLSSISVVSAREIIEQLERLVRVPGDKLCGIVDSHFIPEKGRDYLAKNIILGFALAGIGCQIPGAVICLEAQQQKSEAHWEEKKIDRIIDRSRARSLIEPNVEARSVQSIEQGNLYIEGNFEHSVAEQAQWKAQ